MKAVNFRALSLSLVLAAILGLSVPAAAVDSCCGSGAASLSPEKQELANKLYEEFSKSTEAVRQELIAKRHELGAQMYSAKPDENKIQALAKEISDLRAKLYSARVSLKGRLIKEGITFGHGGHGPGMGRGRGCGGCGGGDCGRGMGGPW